VDPAVTTESPLPGREAGGGKKKTGGGAVRHDGSGTHPSGGAGQLGGGLKRLTMCNSPYSIVHVATALAFYLCTTALPQIQHRSAVDPPARSEKKRSAQDCPRKMASHPKARVEAIAVASIRIPPGLMRNSRLRAGQRVRGCVETCAMR